MESMVKDAIRQGKLREFALKLSLCNSLEEMRKKDIPLPPPPSPTEKAEIETMMSRFLVFQDQEMCSQDGETAAQ